MGSTHVPGLAAFQQQKQLHIGSPGSAASSLATSLYPISPPAILGSPNPMFNPNIGKNMEPYDLLKFLPGYSLTDFLSFNTTNPNPINMAAINMLIQNTQFNPMTPANQESCVTPTVSNSSPPEIISAVQQPPSQCNIKSESPQTTTVEAVPKECDKVRKRKSKAKVTAVPGMPIVQRIRRRKRNGSIPEEDEPPAPQKVSPPGCKQPVPPSPEEVSYLLIIELEKLKENNMKPLKFKLSI